jgi:hypothetical protein
MTIDLNAAKTKIFSQGLVLAFILSSAMRIYVVVKCSLSLEF